MVSALTLVSFYLINMPHLSVSCSGTSELRNAAWGNVLWLVPLGNYAIQFEKYLLAAYCYFSTFILLLISSVLPFTFATVLKLFLISLTPKVTVFIWPLLHGTLLTIPLSLTLFVLLAVRLSFTTFFWGPLALCPAFRGCSKLCPWFFFFHTVPPGTPAYLPYSGYSLPIHIWLPDTYFFILSALYTHSKY